MRRPPRIVKNMKFNDRISQSYYKMHNRAMHSECYAIPQVK